MKFPENEKTIKDRTLKMAVGITIQQIEDIDSFQAYTIACDESSDVNNIKQIALELIPLKGQHTFVRLFEISLKSK